MWVSGKLLAYLIKSKNEDAEEKHWWSVTVNSSNLEDSHSLPDNGNKKFIIKLSKRKNANKILRVKKCWKEWTYLL